MSRSFQIPSARRLSLIPADTVSAPGPSRPRQMLSLFDVSDRLALPATEEMPCRAL